MFSYLNVLIYFCVEEHEEDEGHEAQHHQPGAVVVIKDIIRVLAKSGHRQIGNRSVLHGALKNIKIVQLLGKGVVLEAY